MTHRMLLAPAVVAVIAAVEVTRRSWWLAWPLLTTFGRLLQRDPPGPTSEADYLA